MPDREKKKSCSCGRSFTTEEWRQLPIVGHQCEPADAMGPEVHYEYRNCPCRSTLLVEVPSDHAGCALRGSPVRDKDYRGQDVPFDFSRAVYEVRRKRPGALAVLLDGLEEQFPRQLASATGEAMDHWDKTGMPWVVVFNARVARARYRPWRDARSTTRTPFDIHPAAAIVRNGMPPYSAVVWPNETRKLRRKTRGN